ncbi:MAG: hypothetical protein KJ826_14050 [Proteobacteria bacterium]|nr:hypothetical protein [Pseudomonadota bacterium]MBU4035420.1 hypothetical protein [Pseudomonadota bacterium]
MLHINVIKQSLFFKLAYTLLSGILFLGFSHVAYAERHGRSYKSHNDTRYNHNHSYPARGQFISRLPHNHRSLDYRGSRYFYSGGIWYRPHRSLFTIVAPPIGLFVPFLPPFFTTIWVGNVPYYYANEVYYTHRRDGYVVVDPPDSNVSQAPPSTDKMFIYPRLGQNEQKQADDRYECHSWAVSQTNFDPTQPPVHMPGTDISQKRADYQRAMAACLDGRGYTVK